jgi:Trk K+ transport system NAD-binding subunit
MRALSEIDPDPREFTRRQRLLVAYLAGLVSIVLLYTGLYNYGMAALENRPQSVLRSFNAVIATMTTTGFGADAPWETGLMNMFLAVMQVTGVLIGFVTLRVLVIPLFERTPLKLDDRLSLKDDHVVVAEYQRDTEVLLDELEEYGVEYVLLDPDEEEAKRLSDEGYQAINGDPEELADLERASIRKASLLITDAGDRTASIVLSALGVNPELRVISFVPSTRRKAALAEIGVDRVVAPHALIARRLAEKATTPVSVDTDETDDAVDIREVLVRRDSPLHGVRVRDSPLADHSQLTLVAGWFDGELRLPPSPTDRLTPNTVLVVAGPTGAIDDVSNEVAGLRRLRPSEHSRVIIAGFGEGGTAAIEALPGGVDATTIDESPDCGPDVVGDVTEPETLRAAGIDTASALVMTVDDDATTLLAVAMARSLAPDLEILVRVTEAEKASAAFRAGADYVLSVQQVSARLVAAEVHGERVMDPVGQIRLVRADGDAFAGETLAENRGRPDRGWTVVALSRGGEIRTAAETVVEPGDEVFVAGSDEAIQSFERLVQRS